MLIRIFLVILIVNGSTCTYKIISSKQNNVTFRYMNGVEGESDLRECKNHEVCNVVHNRFWVSTLTERLCRCPNGKECPWQWTAGPDDSSMSLSNKSILKFCQPITKMDVCTYKKEAVKVYGKSDTGNTYLTPHNVTVNCVCPRSHYWRLQKYTYEVNDTVVQVFKCVKKRMCYADEFCGHIRTDHYLAYYRCTCPQDHLCIFKDKSEENVQELLYSGPAYKAYCVPFEGL